MTLSTSLKVWFVCKVCSNAFSNLDSFIEHKIQNHLGRFDKIRSIVFEEKTVYLDEDDDDDHIFVSIAHENADVLAPEINTNIRNIPFVSELKENIQTKRTWSTSLKVWFVCTVCLNAFSNLDSFIEHKIQNHLGRFYKIQSIVFEEKTMYLDGDDDDDDQGIFIAHENAEGLAPEIYTNIPFVSELNENSLNCHIKTETPLLQEELQLNSSTSDYAELELNGSKSIEFDANFNFDTANSTNINNCTATNVMQPNVIGFDPSQENLNQKTETNIETQQNSPGYSGDLDLALEYNSLSTSKDTLFEPKYELNLDAGDTFIQPKKEVPVLDDDIDVDLNVKGAAWGESGAFTSTTETGQRSDAAYEEFLLRYSPFVPLKRLTPQEIEDAAAGKFNFLNNYVRPLGRQLLLAARNQDDEDDEMKFNRNADTSLLNSDGTGCRFLDDYYEVNLNEEGHVVFKPNNIDHRNLDPPLGETSIVCTLCKFVTDSKISLKNHMRIHSKPLMCSHVDCFASFDFRPSLQRHYEAYHSPLKPFQCSYDGCYKAYQTQNNLKVHFMDHTGERPFRCTHENCTQEYKLKKLLDIHTANVHSNERPFKCPRKNCSKAFSIEAYLNAHLRKHKVHGNRRCPNSQCGKLFRAPYHLSFHLKFCKNTGNASATSKQFPCPHDGCHNVYKHSFILKRHLMDHSGERPFPCTRQNCTKAFKTELLLARHTSAMHSDELPVKCPRKGCSKGFSSTGLDYVSHLGGHCRFSTITRKKLPQPPATNSTL